MWCCFCSDRFFIHIVYARLVPTCAAFLPRCEAMECGATLASFVAYSLTLLLRHTLSVEAWALRRAAGF